MSHLLEKILLVEDDARIRKQLVPALMQAGFIVNAACTFSEAQAQLFDSHTLILLDLGLPDGSGLDLCRELRGAHDETPVIVLTARSAPVERVTGLEAGADDYISKPFHLPELIARIKAVLRRSPKRSGEQRLTCGDLWLSPDSHSAGIGSRTLELKRREFELLQFLMSNPGRTWTRAQLLARVWEGNFIGEDRTVDLHIGRLRAQIEEDASSPRLIQTVWGVGYRMIESDHANE